MALSEYLEKRKTRYIATLREMCDWLEARPDLPAPHTSLSFNLMAFDKKEFLEYRRAAGLEEKQSIDDYFVFRKEFGEQLNDAYFDIAISKNKTCVKVKTGTKIVPATPELEIDQFEWVCDEPLLADSVEQANE